jgi:hypothetical protein
MSNMEKFNKFVGALFGKMYEEFPMPIRVEPESFLREMLSELDTVEKSMEFPDFFRSTIKWLERYGYLWIVTDSSTKSGAEYEVVLSERGLEALRKIPDSLEGNASIGERLALFSKAKASDALSTLISLAITTAAQG